MSQVVVSHLTTCYLLRLRMQAAVEAAGLFAPRQPSNAPLLVLRTVGREIGETSERFTYTTGLEP